MGKKTDFWADCWCGSVSLEDKFPSLYTICTDQGYTVAEVAARNWNLHFRRWLDVANQSHYRRLRDILAASPLNAEADTPEMEPGR